MASRQVTTFVHDPSGREIEKQLDNETRAVTAYDAAGQPLVVSNLESDNSVISRFMDTYDSPVTTYAHTPFNTNSNETGLVDHKCKLNG